MDSTSIRHSGHCWYIAPDMLHDDKELVLNWLNLVPKNIGTETQRSRLICDAQNIFYEFFKFPRRGSREIANATVANWFRSLSRLTRWMASRKIWKFSDISKHDLADYIKFCSVRMKGQEPLHTRGILAHIQLLREMWELGKSCKRGLVVSPDGLDLTLPRVPRRLSGWRALDESIALPLLGDAIKWLDSHQEYLLSVIKRRSVYQHSLIKLSRSCRARMMAQFYKDISKEEGCRALRRDLRSEKASTYCLFRNAMAMTDGACITIILFLEGMRASELIRLDFDCLRPRRKVDGANNIKMTGIAAKRGGVRRTWIACEPVVAAVNYFEEAYADVRKKFEMKALIVNQSCSNSALSKRAGRISRNGIAERLRAFAKSPYRKGPPVSRIHPHVARKTFARFVVMRDKNALESLAYHYGHIFRAITDGSYVGSDLQLQKLLQEEGRLDLVRGLTDILSAQHVGGKAGERIATMRDSKQLAFRGKKGLASLIEKLIREGVQLAPCDWGYCVYAQLFSACQGDADGPNEARRSADVCSVCPNFAVTERHRPWWEARKTRDDEFLQRDDVSEQAIKWVHRRRANTERILIGLNGSAWAEQSDFEERTSEESGKT
ncbi:hypothetical protein PQQ51_12585 [Paraburkholderia xenovorans]|uniref:hypothetical protein n=1 Tax=Paraburkholderia xenovorans TaxID=36873 RepID=UPI0038BBF3B1